MPSNKILIIEDEAVTAIFMQRILEKRGYSVKYESVVGKDTFSAIENFSPDLIIMDIWLKSERDGIEYALEVKNRYAIPVIFITAFSDEDTFARAIVAEPYGYIIKPVNDKELIITVDIALYKHGIDRAMKESEKRYRELANHIQKIREEERVMIAREIHDELGQDLTAIKMDISMMKSSPVGKDPSWQSKFDDLSELVNSAINTVRRIASDLRPGILDDIGLAAAIEWKAGDIQKRTGLVCNLFFEGEEVSIEQSKSVHVYRIFQESMTNVIRYSSATEVNINFGVINGVLMLKVSDNGRGIEQEEMNSPKSLGITGMKERASACGGQLVIKTEKGKGTTLITLIPVEKKN